MKKNLLNIVFLSLSFFSVFGMADDRGNFVRTLWSCNVPCQSKFNTGTIQGVQLAYCGVTTLTPEMIRQATPVCQEKHKTNDVQAVRVTTDGYLQADCSTSGHPCKTEGLAKMMYECEYLCGMQPSLPLLSSVCAPNGADAWNTILSLCPDAKVPKYLAALNACRARGETPCAE